MLLLANSRHLIGRKFNVALTLSWPSFSTSADVPINVPEPRLTSNQVAQFRKGPGGRASFSGNVITVFGANGSLGFAVTNRLAKFGNQLIIPYRCDPYWVRELKINGDLGQILFFPFNLKDEDAIRKTVKYSNIVINLLGTRVNTKNFSMYDTHEHGARRIARICREMGVQRLIHISAMGADPNYKSVVMKNANFLRSKGLGEIAVRDEFPDATIVRPSIMYGEADFFIYPMLSRIRKSPIDWVKVYKCGEETYKMPIYINDVAAGINKTVNDPTSIGKTYEFVGPHNYKLAELLDFMFAKARVIPRMGHTYRLIDHFDPWYTAWKMVLKVWGKVFRKHTRMNMEWIEYVEGSSDFLTGNPVIGDLGVTHLAEFENVGAWHALVNSYAKSYEERYKEIDIEPALPIRSPPIFKGQPIPPPRKVEFSRRYFLPDLIYTFTKLQMQQNVDQERPHPRTFDNKNRTNAHLDI